MKQRSFFSVLVIALCSFSMAHAGDSSSAKIDEILAAHWKAKGVEPQPAASDEIFVRRIYLDVAGRIPTADEARKFLADEKPSAAKRSALIDELLASEGYVNHFYNFWADILRVNDNQGGGQNIVPAYAAWLRTSLEENTGYDEMVRTLITAEGAPYENGAMGYTYRDRGMPLDHMANTVRIFLGTRLECAQCHDHPFDKWTQMDFFKMAAFSYGMSANGRRGGKLQDLQNQMNRDKEISRDEKRNLQRAFQEISRPIRNYNVVEYSADKLPQLPHDYKYSDGEPKQKIEARTMFGENPEIASPGERLQVYAKWMTSSENPRFTKVVANRLWKEAMGLGLVEPVDEFTDETEAAVPELFTYLEEQMVSKNYDMKAFLRMIYHTQAYQREATPEEIYVPKEFAFTGPVLRRMSAEQLWDSVVTLVNVTPDMGNWRATAEREAREMAAQRLTDALTAKSEQQLMNDVKRVAKFQADLQDRLIEIQKQQAAARKAKDQDKIKSLGQESNRIRSKLRNWIMDEVYQPALAKSPVQRVSLKLPEGLGEVKMNPSMVDGNGRPTGELRKQLDAKVDELIEKEIQTAGIEDKRERASYLSFRRSALSNFTRAAHRRSPEQPGHFLRQFGQSDRETIENAEAAASVPQALTMINGPLFTTLANPQSVLMREVAEAQTPDEKIDSIFLSLVGRPANADEKSMLTGDLEKRGDELYQDVVFALMNSPEFFFVR
jgi:hypothetical protein